MNLALIAALFFFNLGFYLEERVRKTYLLESWYIRESHGRKVVM